MPGALLNLAHPALDTASGNKVERIASSHSRVGTSQKNFTNGPQKDRLEAESRMRLAWLGYPQELSRGWGFWSSFSLSFINLGTTTGGFWSYPTAFIFGGPVTLFWGTAVAAVVMLTQNMVLGELASAYPAAGAIFTWTFKLAHSNPKLKRWANFISWLTAVYLFASHLIFQVADSCSLSGLLLKVIRFAFPTWKATPWELFGVSCLNLLLTGAFIFLSWSRSPQLWVGLGAITVGLSVAIYTVILCTTNFRRAPTAMFVGSFENTSQVKSNGWAFLIAALDVTASAGAENAAHMAEETHQPEVTVPRAMFFATISSYINFLVLQVLCYMCFSDEATHNAVSFNSLIAAHCPRHASIFIFSSLLIISWIQQLSQLLASSRFTWALARDNAFPLASVWRQLNTRSRMPRNATALLIGLSICFSLLIGFPKTELTLVVTRSDFYLSTVGYFIPIFLYSISEKDVLYRDGRNVWTLQRWSKPLTYFILAIMILRFAIGGFPMDSKSTTSPYPVRAVAITSIPVVGIGGIIAWFMYGRQNYIGPIKSITAWTTGQPVELPKLGTDNAVARHPGVGSSIGVSAQRAAIHEESAEGGSCTNTEALESCRSSSFNAITSSQSEKDSACSSQSPHRLA